MFFHNKKAVLKDVFNPLEITGTSVIEFNIGKLKDKGLYRFKKIIAFDVGGKQYARYLILSKTDEVEHIMEVFPGPAGKEAYLYDLTDTIPFSEEFLDVAGQKFLTTPSGDEYQRCVLPDGEERIDGIAGTVKVYNIEDDIIEKEYGIKIWDYQRDLHGRGEYLNIEMSEESGMFRIFTGELVEDIFYKLYLTT